MKLWNRLKRHPFGEVLKCSFCNKSQDQVEKLIAAPPGSLSRAYICNECIAICNSILQAYDNEHST